MNDNEKTLQSYENNVQAFVDGTRGVVTGDVKEWLDMFTATLQPASSILEVGSAFGRDATYLENQGFQVTCSDAVDGFVELLTAHGHVTKNLNILTDPIEGTYDAVIANAVFLHFNESEFRTVLDKIYTTLPPHGLLAFSVKRGEGSEWSEHKLNAPRFFQYWTKDKLDKLLSDANFIVNDMHDGTSTNKDKIYVIAQPNV